MTVDYTSRTRLNNGCGIIGKRPGQKSNQSKEKIDEQNYI
jgi:hypothetical protein